MRGRAALRLHADDLGAMVALVALVSGDAWAARDDLILVSRASGGNGAAGNDRSRRRIGVRRKISDTSRSVPHRQRGQRRGNQRLRPRSAGRHDTRQPGERRERPAAKRLRQRDDLGRRRLRHVPASATNLSANDVDGGTDVFVRDLQAGAATSVSREGTGHRGAEQHRRRVDLRRWGSSWRSLHRDEPQRRGRPGRPSRPVRARPAGEHHHARLPRHARDRRRRGGRRCVWRGSISADGRFVAFVSRARDLSDDDRDATDDVFVRDLQTRTTTLVSGASDAWRRRFRGFGRRVQLPSRGTRATSTRTASTSPRTSSSATRRRGPPRSSAAPAATGTPSDGFSTTPSISSDGRLMTFESEADGLSEPGRTSTSATG